MVSFVDRCQRRIAPAPLIPPFLSRSVGEEGGRGEGEGRQACSVAPTLNPCNPFRSRRGAACVTRNTLSRTIVKPYHMLLLHFSILCYIWIYQLYVNQTGALQPCSSDASHSHSMMQLATVVRGGGTPCHSVPNVVLPTRIVLAFAINVAPNSFRYHQNRPHRQFSLLPQRGR
jgi:hypothetical protein